MSYVNILSRSSTVSNISKMVSSDPSETPVSKIRVFYHHMNQEQRDHFKDVNISVPAPEGFDTPMSLAAFVARTTKAGYDKYLSEEVLPMISTEQRSINNHILSAPMDNKFFVDKFSAPNPTFAKYTDPELYQIVKNKVVNFIINNNCAMTQVKSFCEIIACRILTLLNDPLYYYTLSYALHNTFKSTFARDYNVSVKQRPAGSAGVTYINSTGTFHGSSVRLDKPYGITEAKKKVSYTAEDVISGATGKKVCVRVVYVTPGMVRFPEGVKGDAVEIARELNTLVTTVVSLSSLDQLYAGAVANKETGLVNYGGGISAHGCHYHSNPECSYSQVGFKYDAEVKCKCGESKSAQPHYDVDVCGAGMAECDCAFSPTTVVSRFCNTFIRESRYLPRKVESLDPETVPAKLIGKPYGPFTILPKEDEEHVVSYKVSDRILQGQAFVKKISQLTPLFKLTPAAMTALHAQTPKGLDMSDERLTLAVLASMPYSAYYDIDYKACIMKSAFGYSVKYELHGVIAKGIPTSGDSKYQDDGDSFEDDEAPGIVTPSAKVQQTPARSEELLGADDAGALKDVLGQLEFSK